MSQRVLRHGSDDSCSALSYTRVRKTAGSLCLFEHRDETVEFDRLAVSGARSAFAPFADGPTDPKVPDVFAVVIRNGERHAVVPKRDRHVVHGDVDCLHSVPPPGWFQM